MMVSVPPQNLVSILDAGKAVKRCKSVMEDCGFTDIHCEIRESSVIFSAAEDATTGQATPQATKLIGTTHTDDTYWCFFDGIDGSKTFNSMIGTEIAMLARPKVTASKGLYLRGEYSGQQYTAALTCRHLLTTCRDSNINIEPQKGGNTMQTTQTNMEHGGLSVIQWGAGKLEGIHGSNKRFLEYWIRLLDERNPRQHARIQQKQAIYKSQAAFLQRISDAPNRVFGTVFLSPSIGPSPRGPGVTNPWLMDWMLIRLHACRHEEELSQINNTLHLSREQVNMAASRAEDKDFARRLLLTPEMFERHGFNSRSVQLPLKDIIRISEIRNPVPERRKHGIGPATLVGKLGPKTDLTFGYASTFTSVIRTPIGGDTTVTEVWPVITSTRNYFSDDGDSGSCVWGLDGRVAGIVVAGNGKQLEGDTWHDITYVVPMEAILENMKRRGFVASV
ncbi:hypothetical protein MY3296_001053 [Beauveria thailandica]